MNYQTIQALRNVLFFAEQYANELPLIGDNELLADELLEHVTIVTNWLDNGGI